MHKFCCVFLMQCSPFNHSDAVFVDVALCSLSSLIKSCVWERVSWSPALSVPHSLRISSWMSMDTSASLTWVWPVISPRKSLTPACKFLLKSSFISLLFGEAVELLFFSASYSWRGCFWIIARVRQAAYEQSIQLIVLIVLIKFYDMSKVDLFIYLLFKDDLVVHCHSKDN